MKGHFSADYKDRFGHTRETALGNLKDVLRHFFVLGIRSQGSQMQLTHDTATITTNLTLTGTGSAATEWITQEVNRLPTPWTFTWQKASFWPWDWQLTKVDNEGLVIPSGTVF